MAAFSNNKILLVGDISKAFSDLPSPAETGYVKAGAEAIKAPYCQVYSNISDAIEAAGKEDFRAIGIVMSDSLSKSGSALERLREANPGAKIVLLVQMHQEPAAIELVGQGLEGVNIADDYVICPVRLSRFRELVEPVAVGAAGEGSVSVDAGTEMKIKELEKLATEDELTGLKNRRYIWEFCKQVIERARQGEGRVTLLVFDIDNFKHYNDVYGHSAGDKILKQAAILMRRCCRPHDVVGRIGGDEFSVVFWNVPGIQQSGPQAERRSAAADHPRDAIFIIKRLRRELKKTKFDLLGPEGKGVLTISGGLASFPHDGSTVQELFSQVDNALLDAKRSGKNRIYLVGEPESDIADIE
jgi:diguanylate cyclase (GGDEF)-like protein